MTLWTVRSRPLRPLVARAAARNSGRATRRTVVLGGLAYLGTLLVGAWAISNLDGIVWVGQYGWWFLTDLAGPASTLAAVVAASDGGWSGLLTASDRYAFAAGISVVVMGATVTWVRIGPVASLTPLLLGAASLVAMRVALIERRNRAHTETGGSIDWRREK